VLQRLHEQVALVSGLFLRAVLSCSPNMTATRGSRTCGLTGVQFQQGISSCDRFVRFMVSYMPVYMNLYETSVPGRLLKSAADNQSQQTYRSELTGVDGHEKSQSPFRLCC